MTKGGENVKHATTGLLAALALTGLTSAGAVAGDSQEHPGYTFTRTPSHGRPGTVIHVEGTGCEYQGQPYEYARVYLSRAADGNAPPRAEGTYDVADDGSFAGELTVPTDAPPDRYRFNARCVASDMVFPVADSDFTVDSPSSTTTPSPEPTPSRTRTTDPTPTSTPRPRPTTRTPSTSRMPTPRPTGTSPALPSATPPVATPSPSAVANDQPADPPSLPAALVLAAVGLIAANGLGLRAALRRPAR